jgi:hypothetical protein
LQNSVGRSFRFILIDEIGVGMRHGIHGKILWRLFYCINYRLFC